MAREGAGEASALSPDGVSIPMAFTAIALYFASDVSVHGGGLNDEGCHRDRKHGGYHCRRGGSSSSRSYAVSTNRHTSSRIAPVRVSRDSGVFSNCANDRAARAAPVRCGEPEYGPHLDRDGVECEPRQR
jgi:hypothetical protein